MAATVALVLRKGPEYKPVHVYDFVLQLEMYAPPHELIVLTDMDVPGVKTVPLKHAWPGWWSKMELFRPDIEGDLLYFDLDTRIVGYLDDVFAVDKLTMLRDPYRDGTTRPEALGSGVMYLPAADRAEMWEKWRKALQNGHTHRGRGDQEFLQELWIGRAQRWQDVCPGQLLSYKADVKGKGTPEECRIVFFHGHPRPWHPSVKL